ncbi:MAG: hypothetical protein NZ550_00590 [Fimbriimonadales bacterium]|nr:hypothetical protein [Fimbriimonadales bacterium]MDW8051715.1 hypothetical protein [Armatimonadota bacterium]
MLATLLLAIANAQYTIPPMITPGGITPPITIPKEVFDARNRAVSASATPRAQEKQPRTQRRNTLDALKALRSWEALEEEFERTVTISGRKTIGFHLHDIEGDAIAFRDQNYFGQGGKRFTDNTMLTIRVNKFLGFFTLDWHWTNHRFRNPYDARITYTYESPNFTVEWGDITAALGGSNPLVQFQRTLKGLTATARWGNTRLRYITSETKASARTITIQGNDSSGPYYLQASQIVEGSERVQVDGVEKRRGEDYTIDYFGGILRFRDGMIIPRTSTIVVTYETYALNAAPNRLDGWRLETSFGRGVNLGVSVLSQKSAVRRGLRRRQEQFYGFGAPSTPYDLQFPPLRDPDNPIIVTVAGVRQVEGVDYYFDEVLPYRFYFTRFMPSTLIIQVEYTPRPDPSSTIGGDREVVGLDLTLPIGRSGSLVWNAARSKATAIGAKLEATAHVLTGRFEAGRLSLNGIFRDIPAEFVGIESVGFRRNERGYQADLSYKLSAVSSFQASISQLRVASINPFSPIFSVGFTDTRIQTLTFTHAPRDGWQLTLNHNANATRTRNSRTDQNRYSLSLARGWRTFNFAVGYERSRSDARGALGTGSRLAYDVQSIRSQLDWTPNTRLTIRASLAQSEVQQAQTSSGRDTNTRFRSRDYTVEASWRPSDMLSVTYRWRESDSGTLGVSNPLPRSRQFTDPLPPTFGVPTNPWGVGYNGNGFSSGAPLFSGFTYYGVRGSGQDFSLQWMPIPTLTIDLQWSENRSEGDLQTNSAQKSLSASISYAPFSWLALAANWSRQDVRFLSAVGTSRSEFLTLSADIGPLSRWTVSLNFYTMTTRSVLGEGFQGRQGTFVQQPRGFSARITYDVGRNQNLFAEFQRTDLKGYQPARDTLFSIGYEYRITRNWSFVASYRFREQLNLDPQYSQHSYRARSLDLSLNWAF